MKRIQMTVATVALTCVLSATALAGDIPLGGFAPPPPPPTTEATSAPLPGEVPSGGFAQPTLSDEVIVNVLGILCGLAL